MAKEETPSGGFSLNFGAGKSQPARKRFKISEADNAGRKELVTGIGEEGLVSTTQNAQQIPVAGNGQPRVIQNQGNDFRGLNGSRRKERFIPQANDIQRVDDANERFEAAAQEEIKTEVKYGLNLMRQAGPAVEVKQEIKQEFDVDGRTVGIERTQQVVRSRGWEAEAYNRDVGGLPDVGTLEDYEDMPVDFFGEAMLRGMGWKGPNNEEAQAVQYVRRPQLLGLGASPAMPTHDKRDSKDVKHKGRTKPERKDLVVYDKHGNIKHTMKEGDKLEERRKLGAQVGKWMRILKGQHEGLRCKVVTIHDKSEERSQRATVRLHPSEEAVSVRLKELGETDEKPERRRGHGSSSGKRANDTEPQDLRGDNRDLAAPSNDRQDGENGSDRAGKSRRNGHFTEVEESIRQEGNEGPGEPWLTPHIRVKVIDKKIGKGRYYLKKGEVIDVMTPFLSTVLLDSGDRIEVSDSQIETSIPKKEGARVLILLGKHRRKRAKMLHRSSQLGQAALQLTEDYTIVKCDFSEFAEFVGDLGEEE